jgi:predicted FMN-binding regulatory protein PaiB
MKMINNLTNQHEAKQEVPWAVADTPAVFTKKMVQGYCGSRNRGFINAG